MKKLHARSLFMANLGMALAALQTNRLRTFLTSLGVFIGVAAVIAALTLTEGASAYVRQQIEGLGTNTIVVSPGAARLGGVSKGAGSLASLTALDAQRLEQLNHVAAVSPIVTLNGSQALYGQQKWNTQVQGVTASFQNIQNWVAASGTWFSQQEEQSGQAVVVLGSTVAHSLFDASGVEPVGQFIQIQHQMFRVVGTLQPKGGMGFFNQDDVVFIPLKTATTRLINTTTVDQIYIQVDHVDHIESVKNDVAISMRASHHLGDQDGDDFRLITSVQILQQSQQISQVLTFLLAGIASISLTVGGIGIMNIMLVSVTERTREIGLRMALGARRADIRNQFLTESLVLCFLGGAIGMIIGYLVGWIITNNFHIPFIISPLSLSVPLAVSLIVGLVFGLYPAIRASRLDPIEALRIED